MTVRQKEDFTDLKHESIANETQHIASKKSIFAYCMILNRQLRKNGMYACSPKYKPMYSHAETAYWKTNSPTISDYMKHPSILKTVLAQAKRAVFIYSLLSCTGLSAFADNVETLGGFAYFRCNST